MTCLQSAVFLLNSRSHHFTATLFCSSRRAFTYLGRTFFRSYGANLPSSFTRVLSSALEFSSCPRVSVYGTVSSRLKLRGFSWKRGICNFAPRGHSSSRLGVNPPDFPGRSTYTLEPGHPTPGLHNLLRPPIASKRGIGILTDFPSTTPFGLALGTDSPCTDERSAGNLGLSASGPFTRFIATHVSIRTSDTSSSPYGPPSQAYRTLSYHACNPFSSLQGCRRSRQTVPRESA